MFSGRTPSVSSPSGRLAAPMRVASGAPPGRRTEAKAPMSGARVTGTKFIAGVPMKPATKRVAGRR